MKAVIKEYAGAVTGLVGAMGILVLLGSLFYSDTGFLAILIQRAIEGG